MGKVFLYVEFQACKPFGQVDFLASKREMDKFPGLISKTWLSGRGNNSLGGFYQFETAEQAVAYTDGLLVPLAKKMDTTVSTKLFDAEIVRDACISMRSPYFPAAG